MVAAFGLGGGWEALDRAIRYSTERVQGGAPLSEKQGYTHKLIVPHVVRLEAARAVRRGDRRPGSTAGDGADGALNTEGAIAKYLATEAGVAAADAAIQAHGGYGYTRPYLVEKIRRDVRITTIYEGTSEIMEMTIARDRWQHHLKTRGGHYARPRPRSWRRCTPRTRASAPMSPPWRCECLAAVLEACRVGRLTRNQHVLLRLGELIAHAEAAAALVRRARRPRPTDGLPEKADRRFAPEALAAISRVFARDAALKVAEEGVRWVAGAADPGTAGRSLAATSRSTRVRAAQAGLIADMDARRRRALRPPPSPHEAPSTS